MTIRGCWRWATGLWARRKVIWVHSSRHAIIWSGQSLSVLLTPRQLAPIGGMALTITLWHWDFFPRLSWFLAIQSNALLRADKLCPGHERWDYPTQPRMLWPKRHFSEQSVVIVRQPQLLLMNY